WKHNVIGGNSIGTDASDTLNLGNSLTGVQITAGAQSNLVDSNRIEFNGTIGVNMNGAATTANAIRRNSIQANGGLGIDLNSDGVTFNDQGDANTGTNNLQNFPVIAGAVAGASTRIVGSLFSTPSTAFTLDFFANSASEAF